MTAMRWIAVVGAMVGALGMQRSASHPPAPVDRPECPHSWNDSTVGDTAVPPLSTWPTLNVAEINDCQRFIGAPGGRRVYLPGYFAIFAYPDTASVSARVAAAGHESAVLVAFIYAESVAYTPLSIRRGGSCLYLFVEKRTWTAVVKPATLIDGQRGCETRTSPATGFSLPVRRLTSSSTFADYPNTSRWDWDPVRKVQYAGVRCDDGWCDVGGGSSSPTHPEYAVGATARQRRTAEVKGWYDEQYLDRCGAGGFCRPTALVGTIIPDSSVDEADRAYYTGQFRPVARVAIRVDPSVPEAAAAASDLTLYWTKFHFRPTPNPHELNKVSLCAGRADECGIPDSVATKCAAAPAAPEEVDKGGWWYKVVPSTGESPKYGCYVRRTYMSEAGHVYGAARWRWMSHDATNWTRCAQGCCELQGGP